MMIDPEIEFPKVEKMMHKISWSFSRAYLIEYEDCIRECHFAFAKAATRYDSDRTVNSSFSTYLYNLCQFALIDLVKSRVRRVKCDVLEDNMDVEAPECRSPSLELLCDIGDDAKEILSLLLDTPHEILRGRRMSPRKLLKLVAGHLNWEKGPGSYPQIKKAIEEIRTTLQQGWAENKGLTA